jgi:hypothetical protein
VDWRPDDGQAIRDQTYKTDKIHLLFNNAGISGGGSIVTNSRDAESGQPPVGARGLGGGIDEPPESQRELYRAIVGLTHRSCHELSLTTGFSTAIPVARPRRHR